MKKLFLTLLATLIPALCMGATASWTGANPGGVPITGFTLEMEETLSPGVIIGSWNPAVATQDIPDTKFMPGIDYSFRVQAYNASGTSFWSPTATFTTTAPAYAPPAEVTPPDVVLPPVPPAPDGMTLDSAIYTFVPVP